MLRVTLRSFWEHKRRLISTVIADRARRRLHGRHVRAHRHARQGLRRPLRGGERRGRRPGPGRGPLHRPLRRATSAPTSPEALVDDVAAVDGVAGGRALRDHDRLRKHQPGPRRRRRADRARPKARPRCSRAGSTDERAVALRPRRTGAARRPTTRSPSTWPPSRTPASRSATRSRSSPSSAARSTRSSASFTFGTAKSSAGAVSVDFTLARGPATRRHRTVRSRPCSLAATTGVSQAAARRTHRAEVAADRRRGASPARRRPPSCPPTCSPGFAFFQQALTDLRRHRAAGRHLRHLQHLLDPRRAAHPRAGAAPSRRRGTRPGAGVGAARGDPRRPRRRRRSACWRACSSPRASPPRSTPSAPTCPRRPSSCARPRSCIAFVIGLVVTLVAALIPARPGHPRVRRSPRCATSPSTGRARRSARIVARRPRAHLRRPSAWSAAWTSDGDTDDLSAVGLGAAADRSSGRSSSGRVLAGPSIRPSGIGARLG